MKEGWEVINFEDCLEKVVYTNKIQRKDFLEEGRYPIVSQESEYINGYWNNADDLFIVKKPIIVFGDHTQVIKYIDFDFVLGADGVKILQPINKLNPRFFYYYMLSIEIKSLGYARHYRILKEKVVTIPPLPEQQRIVETLDEAFTAIAKAKENAEKNLQNAREIFQSYLHSVFANPGDGWEEKKLGEVSKINYGYTEKSSYKEIGPKFLRITDIQDNNVEWNTVPFCMIEKNILPKYKLSEGDIVFARTGATTGKSFLVHNPPLAVFASYLIRLQIIELTTLSPEFLYLFFQTEIYWENITAGLSGSAQGGFNATKLSDMTVPIPPLSEQNRIVSALEILAAETKKLEAIYNQKLADLEELKKSILEKAFSGELNPPVICG